MASSDLTTLIGRTNELLEILVRLHLNTLMDKELEDPSHRRLYELTGEKSAAQIKKELRMSSTTISRLWSRWEQMGLLLKEGRTYRRIF